MVENNNNDNNVYIEELCFISETNNQSLCYSKF